jgi:hypothetical protein
MRFRFTIAGMLWFSVLIGLLCTLGTLGYKLSHPRFTDRLAASADGRLLVVSRNGVSRNGIDPLAGRDSELNVWDTASGRLLQNIATASGNYMTALAMSPDGRRIAIRDVLVQRTELWVREGSEFRPKKIPTASIDGTPVAISQDARWQVTYNALKKEFGIWSLDDGTKRATCAEATKTTNRSSVVGLDQGSGRLVVGYDDGHVDVFDAASGRLQKTIVTGHPPGSPLGEVVLSPDGRWAAFSVWDLITNPPAEKSWVSVIDLDNGNEVLRDDAGDSPQPAAFSRDSRIVAVVEDSSRPLHFYELPSGAPRGDLADSGSPFVADVASLGPDRWALTTSAGVELWRTGALQPDAVLGDASAGDELGWATLGLAAWIVISAVIHLRRSRIACSVCGQVRMLARRKPQPICTVCAQQIKRTPAWLRVLAAIGVFTGLFAIGFPIRDWVFNRPIDWLSPFVPVAAVSVAVALYLLLFIAWYLWRVRRLKSVRYDLKRARRAAGNKGVLRRDGSLAVWSAADSDWHQQAHQWMSKDAEDFSQLTGLEADCQRPSRLLVFEDWGQFDRYLKLYGLNCWPWSSIELPGDKVAMSIEGVRGTLVEPRRWLQGISSNWFRAQYPALRAASWLVLGYLPVQDEWSEMRLLRKLRLRLASEPAAGDHMFDASVLLQMMRRRRWYATDDYMRLIWLLLERVSFTSYLAGTRQDLARRSLLREAIGELAGGADWSRVAGRHYQSTPQQLIAAWRDWILGQTPGDYPRAEPWQRQIIVDELLPIACDRQQPTIARLRVVRGLGDAGFTLAAPAMLDLMTDTDPLVRADAAQALTMISGYDHGDDLRAWRAWCDSLPADESAVATGNG